MKIILLKQGVHPDKVPEGHPELMNIIPEICGAITLLKAEKEGESNIIVDTGNFGFEQELLDALAKEGLKPEDIKYVINTHGHYDHLSNNYLFKNADRTFGKGIWHPDKSIDVYKELAEIPGVKLISTPGHVNPHISVVVKSEGKTFVIAGDAIQEEYIKKGLFGVPSNQDYIDSAKKIVDIADVIIPGHGKIIEGKDLEELKKAVYKMEVE